MSFWRTGTDLAIDLGTATVLVYAKGKGVVLKEPSVVAINNNNKNILAIGDEARKMIGRTPGNIVAVRPLRDGVISDYDLTQKMLKEFIKKASGKRNLRAPNVVVCVPSEATEVEKRAVIDATMNSGAKTVRIIEEPLAAAIGAGIDITKPNGCMVVDIGGGTCDIAVISLGGVVERESIKIAGDKFDDSIIKYVRSEYKLMIGEKTAEELKINIGSAFKNARNLSCMMKGRNLVTGLPDEVEINTEEIRLAIQEPVQSIVDCVKIVLERTPPELAADIIEKGIVMTGGGSLINGLDKLIQFKTGVAVTVEEGAEECVVNGSGEVLGYLDRLDREVNSQQIVLIE